jgi:hypothetical protein
MRSAISISGLLILAWNPISLGAGGASDTNGGSFVGIGALKSRVPADWVEEQPDHARWYKQYRLEPVNDDKTTARLTIGFLSNGKHSSATNWVKRWKGMFLPPERRTMQEAAKVRRLTVNGVDVTYLDVRGDYKGVPGDNTTPQQNFRLLGAYFDTPQGPYQIRLLGPADTVEFYRKGFEDWLTAFK